jgi:NADP-dependent 3-hydroxy acid dehydrogenase YdfG
VIVSGRRKEKLNQFVQEHGSDKADQMEVDLSKLDGLPAFVKKYVVCPLSITV